MNSICKFIDNPDNIADFSTNTIGCNSRTEVKFECFGLLPVNFVSTFCNEKGNFMIEVENEINVRSYELIAFVNQKEIPLGSINYAPENKGKYTIYHKGNADYDLYKIKQKDTNGDHYYSDYFTCDLSNLEWDVLVTGNMLEIKSNEIMQWTITDYVGQIVQKGSLQNIDISNLAKGIYYIKNERGIVKKFLWL